MVYSNTEFIEIVTVLFTPWIKNVIINITTTCSASNSDDDDDGAGANDKDINNENNDNGNDNSTGVSQYGVKMRSNCEDLSSI